MDQGLYNKRTEPRGDHGTLIGNWYEERALQGTTGYTRHAPYALEKTALPDTNERNICHSDHRDFPNVRESIATSSFAPPTEEHWPDKFYHRVSMGQRESNAEKQKTLSEAQAAAQASAVPQAMLEQTVVPAQQVRARYAMPITRYGPGSVPPIEQELEELERGNPC